MNNVAYLFDDEQETIGVKVVSVPAYQTSDGRVFHSKADAERHEAEENLIKTLVHTYNKGSDRIAGTTIRGWGDEWVPARQEDVIGYTRRIISHLRREKLLK